MAVNAKRWRKKPVEIEAVQWTGSPSDYGAVTDFCPTALLVASEYPSRSDMWLKIPTLEGDHFATPGDWIIRGVAGEFYPCKSYIFYATYEAIE